MTPEKALIAMSGGVDSSVAAYLTQQAGFSCIGATMRLYSDPNAESGCCSADDAFDARSVARRLGMPFYVFNFAEDFRCHVIDAFVLSYEQGLTPNPCIQCNRHLKFDRLLRRGQELGCDYVVTGHYARITRSPDTGRYLLQKAADRAKDQSYFLYCLTQAQLSHVQFPLGSLTKAEVRAIAEVQGFRNAGKRDSQDICFVPDGDYLSFLEAYNGRPYPAGDLIDPSGNIVGRHHGAVGYTLGQRKGLGVSMGQPVYVCDKNMEKNTVTVGPEVLLFHRALLANDWFWFPFPALTAPLKVTAKARSRMAEQPATVYPLDNGFARVEFDTPQRALTPGQAVVLYCGDTVVGGGTVTQVL